MLRSVYRGQDAALAAIIALLSIIYLLCGNTLIFSQASYEEAVNGVRLVVGSSYMRLFALQMPAPGIIFRSLFLSIFSFLSSCQLVFLSLRMLGIFNLFL